MTNLNDGLFLVAAIAACVAVIVGMIGPVQGGGNWAEGGGLRCGIDLNSELLGFFT